MRQWARVSPRVGIDSSTGRSIEIAMALPWRPEFSKDAATVSYTLKERRTWLGRSLALERLEVGTGQIRLTGLIELPTGEGNPILSGTLSVAGALRDLKEFRAEPTDVPGRYIFSATFDGPNTWPAPVTFELTGIGFQTDQTLEWSLPWAKYRDISPNMRRLMDPADQVAVKFYDTTLRTIALWESGVAVDQVQTRMRPPYVTAALTFGGRGDETRPGMELVAPNGKVLRNFGGGGGVIWDDPRTAGQRSGISALWDRKSLPADFEVETHLTLRYVCP